LVILFWHSLCAPTGWMIKFAASSCGCLTLNSLSKASKG
jgi:hypothetical protein